MVRHTRAAHRLVRLVAESAGRVSFVVGVLGVDGPVLRGDPVEMARVAGLLSGGADQLHTGLQELDGAVSDTLSGWRGNAGGAFGAAWRLWHEGAGLIHEGLATMAGLLGQAGGEYQRTEESNASELGGVGE